MKIEDLIQLLNNRLNTFKLSRDYAVMSGDLERANAAEIEITGIEDTLYKLNLLVDVSASAAVKETTLADVITDGSVSVLGEYDISPYATDPLHEEKIMDILSKMKVMDGAEKINEYIKGKYESSPVTGEMIMSAASAYAVDSRLMMAIMELDSRFGTAGIATSTLNPGNVGNDDDGNTRTYPSWQAGVTAVAEWLNRHRVTPSETPVIPTPETATTTPEIPPIETATSTPETTATTTPEIPPIETATSTPETTATTTPETASTTTSN
ncbi:MAG: hypothetical protein RLY47_20 [Candidatus Parcubacteria bacterium]